MKSDAVCTVEFKLSYIRVKDGHRLSAFRTSPEPANQRKNDQRSTDDCNRIGVNQADDGQRNTNDDKQPLHFLSHFIFALYRSTISSGTSLS